MQRVEVLHNNQGALRNQPSHVRELMARLLQRCAQTILRNPEMADHQVVTALPSDFTVDESSVQMKLMVLAEPKDLYVFAHSNEVVIEGWTKEHREYRIGHEMAQETIDRRFTRTIQLPWAIDAQAITVEIRECVLHVTARRAGRANA